MTERTGLDPNRHSSGHGSHDHETVDELDIPDLDGEGLAIDPMDETLTGGSFPRRATTQKEVRQPHSVAPTPLGPGRIVGSYRLLESIGKGGMGHVYRAEHERLGRDVAIKFLLAGQAHRPESLSRFFQEARAVARINHHNIVEILDFVEARDTRGDGAYLVMELLGGESLATWSRHGVALPRALSVLAQICDGLAAAHAVGIIHRDLKPDNIHVVPGVGGVELVKLLDFGVAKLMTREDERVGHETAVGSVVGTPAYMSPEQAGGSPVDARADIYSVGAIMYELFCGEPMFTGRSFGEFVRKHLTEIPIAPRNTRGGAGMDPRFEHVIMRCVAKNPASRYQTALELRGDLLGLLSELGRPTPPISRNPLTGLPSTAIRPRASSIIQTTPWWLWMLVVGTAVLVGIIVAAMLAT